MTAATVVRLLLVLLLLAGGGWAYRLHDGLRTELASAQHALAASKTQHAALLPRVQALEQVLNRSRSESAHVAVESLLLAAAERAQVFADREGAQAALAAADARLSAAREPRFAEVRAAIAGERAALAAVPMADRTALGLSLAALIERAPQWPLATAATPVFEAPTATTPPAPATAGGWPVRVWGSFKTALSSMFSLRRVDGGVRWQTPEQQALIGQILLLRLEGARLAVLRGDDAALDALSASTLQWLASHYKSSDAGVVAAKAELQRLSAQPLTPPLPPLNSSLQRLRTLDP